MIEAVLFDFGETLVERVVDDESPLSDLVVVAFADAAPTLERLAGEGYRVAVVSNTTQSTEDHLRVSLGRIGLERFFGAVVTSFDVGIDKPAPEIFRGALDRLGCTPDRAAMVGNDLTADVGGASALGMTTFLLARGGELPRRDTAIEPTFVVSSLAQVPDLLSQLRQRA